ncbi:MAG: hypothetical protein ACXV5P_09160, partial [Halobacteriota archaeon]
VVLNTIKGITRGPRWACLAGIIVIPLERSFTFFKFAKKDDEESCSPSTTLRTRDRFLAEGE